jgi:hypothetical protein
LSDLDLEEDIEGNPEEVIEEDKDSNETFELTETEKQSRPPIELKHLPSGLRYAFLNSDVESPVIISDKLSEEETAKLIAILQKAPISPRLHLTGSQGHQPCSLHPPDPS